MSRPQTEDDHPGALTSPDDTPRIRVPPTKSKRPPPSKFPIIAQLIAYGVILACGIILIVLFSSLKPADVNSDLQKLFVDYSTICGVVFLLPGLLLLFLRKRFKILSPICGTLLVFIPGCVLLCFVRIWIHLEVIFELKNEETWFAFLFICTFGSFWLGLAVYIDVVEQVRLYTSDALVKGCGHLCSSILIICYCTVILGVGVYWSLKDKGIDESSPLYFSTAMGCYYLVLITQWFVTHNVYVRFDPSRTLFMREADSPRQPHEFQFQTRRNEEVRLDLESSFNIISYADLLKMRVKRAKSKMCSARTSMPQTGIATILLLVTLAISPVILFVLFTDSHPERALYPLRRVKHTVSGFVLLTLPLMLVCGAIFPFIRMRRSAKFYLVLVLALLIATLFLSFYEVGLFSSHPYFRGTYCNNKCYFHLSLGTTLPIILALSTFFWTTAITLFRRMQASYRLMTAAGYILLYSGLPLLLVPHFLPSVAPDNQLKVGAGILTAGGAIMLSILIFIMLFSHIFIMKKFRSCVQAINYKFCGHWFNNVFAIAGITGFYSAGYMYSPLTKWGYACFVGAFLFFGFMFTGFNIALYLHVHIPDAFKPSTIYEYLVPSKTWMISEYDLIMISIGRRKERTVQCCSTLFAFLAIIAAVIMRFDYEGPYFNSILTITVGFVIAALGLVFLTELKIRVGPFAKEMIPAVVVVLWTFVLFPMVCAVPIVTLIDVEYYDEAYACVFLWAIISLLIAVTILFGFLNKLRHFANEFRKRSRYKENLRIALADRHIEARESALDAVIDRYMEPYDEYDDQDNAMQTELSLKHLVADWDYSPFRLHKQYGKVLVSRPEFELLLRRSAQREFKAEVDQLDQQEKWRHFVLGRERISNTFPSYFKQGLKSKTVEKVIKSERELANLFSIYGDVRFKVYEDTYASSHPKTQKESMEKHPGSASYPHLDTSEGGRRTQDNEGFRTDRALIGTEAIDRKEIKRLSISRQDEELSIQGSIIPENQRRKEAPKLAYKNRKYCQLDKIYLAIEKIQQYNHPDRVKDLILLSVEASYKLLEEVFRHFASGDRMQPKMLPEDYDNLVMVIGRLENTQHELREARELREQLLRELNGEDEEGQEEEKEPKPQEERKYLQTFEEFCLFIERMAERDTPAKTPQRSVQLFCAQYVYQQLVLHDPWFFEKPFLYILMGAALNDRYDYRTFIGPNINEEVYDEANYNLDKKPESGFFIRKNCLCPHHLCRLFSFFCFFKRSEDQVKDYSDQIIYSEKVYGRRIFRGYDARYQLECVNFNQEVALPFAKPSYRKRATRYKKKDRPQVPEWTEVVPLIMNSLTRTHVNMNWSRKQLCACTCMNFMVALILALDFFFLVSILYLHELGWSDASQPFAALSFFSSVNNSNKSEGDSFTVLFILTLVGGFLYLIMMTCLLKKAWRGLLGVDSQNHHIVGPCSLHNCIYLFALIFSSWLFFAFMAIYIYVFSCDAQSFYHHRFREIKCYDGGLHLVYVISTLCAVPIYYPIASITWPMLQTVNLSDRVKVSPFFMLFFNHFKILIIATSAFLKHQFIKLFIRSIAIFVILILLLFLVFFLLPCNLLGFNWLLATLVIVAAWLAFCMILFVDGTKEDVVAPLMALGAVALLILFLLIEMFYCCLVKNRKYDSDPPPKPVYKASLPPPPPQIEESFEEAPPPKIELQPFHRKLSPEQVNLRDPKIPELHFEKQKEKANERLTKLLPIGVLREKKERDIKEAKEAKIREAIRRRDQTQRELEASRRGQEEDEEDEEEQQYYQSEESQVTGKRYYERESPLRNEEDIMRRFKAPELVIQEPGRRTSYGDRGSQKEGSGYELQIQYGESGSQITVTEGGTEESYEMERSRRRYEEEEEKEETKESYREVYRRGRPELESRYQESEEEHYQDKFKDRYSRGYYSEEKEETQQEEEEERRLGFQRQDQTALDYNEVDVDMVRESREDRVRRLSLEKYREEEDEEEGSRGMKYSEEVEDFENEQDWSNEKETENEKDEYSDENLEGGRETIAMAEEAIRKMRQSAGGERTPTGWSQFRRKDYYDR